MFKPPSSSFFFTKKTQRECVDKCDLRPNCERFRFLLIYFCVGRHTNIMESFYLLWKTIHADDKSLYSLDNFLQTRFNRRQPNGCFARLPHGLQNSSEAGVPKPAWQTLLHSRAIDCSRLLSSPLPQHSLGCPTPCESIPQMAWSNKQEQKWVLSQAEMAVYAQKQKNW